MAYYNPKYPDTPSLKRAAKRRIPAFAFDYLCGGCHDEIGVAHNAGAFEHVKLQSDLLAPTPEIDLSVELFGQRYAAPFGVAPVGLQGLMWPKAPEILAKAAYRAKLPYVLSTVSSASLETIAEISEGTAWYQLYNPTDAKIREDLMGRIKRAGYKVLVVTVDVPTFGYRPRDIKNGLAMPPKMNLRNILQMMKCPAWSWQTLLAGVPEMQTLKPYMPKNMPTSELANFMNNTVMGAVDFDSLKVIRDNWDGPLVLKGLVNPDDVKQAVALGADAVVLSNHGGRQLDVGESPLDTIQTIKRLYGDKIKLLMDSGVQSGGNVAQAMAMGADFTLLGRTFVYACGAVGHHGGEHAIDMLTQQMTQVMGQLKCPTPTQLPHFLKAGPGVA
ncbi:alpha-hydroxy acid oxidase [Salinivibrio kushneri]|uniref:alpha-hydroxy acid oxidase n=2 Tax=Salinivibrio kushneri TaxID=1908198 RepID=UPI000985615F|nr:alpha-hydroxy acid oxidase [Salinivibrio kushneri]OOE33854.1 alpha-hydroxy-acid oxidizing enzyme [Salinivibrio kushneri]OOE48720.1 alpha-hydroxy-acid oxidizing enzyme [Salinivibrio kushneri]OOE62684.1 alpha-hydroxy-acid oxidizing enzyme [Salinivibrio kushneri]WBA11961.1 alpha-hydroxy acid oxidase [Salinivibrio kushneri]